MLRIFQNRFRTVICLKNKDYGTLAMEEVRASSKGFSRMSTSINNGIDEINKYLEESNDHLVYDENVFTWWFQRKAIYPTMR